MSQFLLSWLSVDYSIFSHQTFVRLDSHQTIGRLLSVDYKLVDCCSALVGHHSVVSSSLGGHQLVDFWALDL